jgi:hypothetical protein
MTKSHKLTFSTQEMRVLAQAIDDATEARQEQEHCATSDEERDTAAQAIRDLENIWHKLHGQWAQGHREVT